MCNMVFVPVNDVACVLLLTTTHTRKDWCQDASGSTRQTCATTHKRYVYDLELPKTFKAFRTRRQQLYVCDKTHSSMNGIVLQLRISLRRKLHIKTCGTAVRRSSVKLTVMARICTLMNNIPLIIKHALLMWDFVTRLFL